MNIYREHAETIQKFMREVHGQDVSFEEIWSVPYWEQIWAHWVALQHYGRYKIEMDQATCRRIYGE
ncbi:hypothetical protein [Cohnella sp. JJ-181]|uniref:hypothetical protein n=1 Tax=Cohnella rhizoplanae TaxID=2974897 RepID=UPI0022FF515D|nr:hypothetical protein [Cohnella sp. JJ-181]CAI6074003.1 hypothetical protein COHCIP112018_02409 [Cohnella sp. JJ-181]